jgi:1-acyl-sn-glycerol-3-phosphate acyltransferase
MREAGRLRPSLRIPRPTTRIAARMSDLFYNFVWGVGSHAFWVSSKPVVLHRERLRRPGAYILAPTHLSEFDVPCLIALSPRKLDWVSIVEVFRKPLVGWFFGSMNAFPLDRNRPDSPTVRTILDRLARGRVVAMFPEGNLRTPETSVLAGGHFKPGVARIAQLGDVPVIPCVIVGTGAYKKVTSWLPLRRVRYGVVFGEPITVRKDVEKHEATRAFVEQLKQAYLDLHAELMAQMGTKPK